MDVKPFRSPLTKFALALWMGCLQWPLTIPIALALPLIYRQPKARAGAFSVLLLFALGWSGRTLQQTWNPILSNPQTACWTCTAALGAQAGELPLRCENEKGHVYGAVATTDPPLEAAFVGTLWPFYSASWRQFQHSKGVHGTIRSTVPSSLPPSQQPGEEPLGNPLSEFLHTCFTGRAPGLILALISGDKRHLDPQLKILLNHAGLAHLMAVSGYHVGLVSFPFLVLLRHRRDSCRFAGFMGLMGTWSFIAFCGFPTSAVRAGLMLTGYGLSQLARTNLSAMHLMSTAAWAMLLYNPQWAADLGMQLSFIAVYSILLGLELLKAARMQHPILQYTAVPIAAQLGTGFIAWPTFGLFPKYFLLFNLLASPFMIALGAVLASLIGMEFMLGWEHAVGMGSKAVDATLNHVLNGLTTWHKAAWTWDLRTVDKGLLVAMSVGALVGGTLVVAKRITMQQFRMGFCALGLGVIPWLIWQSTHRATVNYRYGIVIDAAMSCSVSVTTNRRDSARLVSEREKFGTNQTAHVALAPSPMACISKETWTVVPSEHAGFGQLKSRPFAWKRMDGSTVLFNYGEDTVYLKQWDRPSVVE